MTTPTTLSIPRTTSSAATTGPSFLTTFLTEVRNAIDRHLFKREDPVLIRKRELVELTAPVLRGDSRRFARRLQEYRDLCDAESKADDDFNHGLQYCISLLRTCRQEYHEAVGVLYSENTFVVTRPLHEHDYQTSGYHQIDHTPVWLSGLGSRQQMLRKIVIDADAMCPLECDLSPSCDYDVLPLLRFLWSYPEFIDVVKFEHTGRNLPGHSNGTSADEDEEDLVDGETRGLAQYLNGVLYTLAKSDALQLRRYAYSDRLLESVYICYKTADMFYQRTAITGCEPYVTFDLFGDGTLDCIRTEQISICLILC